MQALTVGVQLAVLHKAQTLLQRYMSLAGGYSGHLGDYSTRYCAGHLCRT
ncbi:hypothetical protein O9992_16265 [Vibrio lentus]|nr:hypothetical protein [Vibrio lentus]